MNEDTRELRAASFGSVAEAYERGRPGYPEKGVRWLTGDVPRTVVDLGAGTGKLTRQVVALGHRVVAVEPLPEMLAQLRQAVPGVEALRGSAEAIPLADESADVVVAAQAFHWFDPDRALPEIARVLRPDGRLGLIWNMRDESVEWMVRLSALLGAERFDYDGDFPAARVARGGLFEPLEYRAYSFSQRVDREALHGLVSSRSYVATLAAEEHDRLLADVDRLYDDVAKADGLVVPYVTHAFRARRRVGA